VANLLSKSMERIPSWAASRIKINLHFLNLYKNAVERNSDNERLKKRTLINDTWKFRRKLLPSSSGTTKLLFFFYVLLTVHLSIFISVMNQLDAQNFCFTVSLFYASTCFEHMCSKHVEAWNKLIVKQNFVHQIGSLLR